MDLEYHNSIDFSEKVGVTNQYIQELFDTKQLKYKVIDNQKKTCIYYWWEFINTKQTRIY